MKKAKHPRSDELRVKYARSDFLAGFVRGKRAARIATSSNIVRLDPDVAAAFPTSQSVNDALSVLPKAAKSAGLPVRSGGPRAIHSGRSLRSGCLGSAATLEWPGYSTRRSSA